MHIQISLLVMPHETIKPTIYLGHKRKKPRKKEKDENKYCHEKANVFIFFSQFGQPGDVKNYERFQSSIIKPIKDQPKSV